MYLKSEPLTSCGLMSAKKLKKKKKNLQTFVYKFTNYAILKCRNSRSLFKSPNRLCCLDSAVLRLPIRTLGQQFGRLSGVLDLPSKFTQMPHGRMGKQMATWRFLSLSHFIMLVKLVNQLNTHHGNCRGCCLCFLPIMTALPWSMQTFLRKNAHSQAPTDANARVSCRHMSDLASDS